jgi:hypothetical protein
MFIAPFWADHIVEQDSPAATFGKIRYGNNGDADKFIVEWDSIGTFDTNGSTGDITTFRVVLNRSNGTVEFQYKSCGANGLDSAALVGMQYDTSSVAHPTPYVFINNQLYPYETKPRDNYCVRFKPTVSASVAEAWNLVSLAGEPGDGNHAKTRLPLSDRVLHRGVAPGRRRLLDPLQCGRARRLHRDELGREHDDQRDRQVEHDRLRLRVRTDGLDHAGRRHGCDVCVLLLSRRLFPRHDPCSVRRILGEGARERDPRTHRFGGRPESGTDGR